MSNIISIFSTSRQIGNKYFIVSIVRCSSGPSRLRYIPSHASCKFECSIKIVEDKVGCVPWYMPHRNSSKVCDPWKSNEFSKLLDVITAENCSCLPDCNSVIYSFSQSSAPFRSEGLHPSLLQLPFIFQEM